MTFTDRAQSSLETEYGLFQIHVFKDQAQKEHLALVMGSITNSPRPILTRIHSECMTGDTLFSHHCDCGEQLKAAMQAVANEQSGIILYMREEGRGIGLTAKIKAYSLQQQKGLDTFAANEALGFAADARDYRLAAEILKELQVTRIRLLTSNPNKATSLRSFGLEVEQIKLDVEVTSERAQKYLQDKSKHNAR